MNFSFEQSDVSADTIIVGDMSVQVFVKTGYYKVSCYCY